jgi:phosphoribosylformylglycinamidine (FGAM) synthase-like enzyme
MGPHTENTTISVSAAEITSNSTDAETVRDLVVGEVVDNTRLELAENYRSYEYNAGMSGYVIMSVNLTGYPDETRGVDFSIVAGKASLSNNISSNVRKVVTSVVDTIHETLETLELECD